jgi:hypothetical protein
MTYSNYLGEVEMKNGLLSIERDTFLLLIRHLSLIPLTGLQNVLIIINIYILPLFYS